VPDQHVLHLVLLEELVVNVEHRAAGIAEDVLDAFFLETANYDFRTRELHDHTFCKSGGIPRLQELQDSGVWHSIRRA
jgi:hypothetical protein